MNTQVNHCLGVNCIDGIVPLLKDLRVMQAIEAFDMDKQNNTNVSAAAERLRSNLIGSDINCTSYTWNPKHNGIDDYLLFCKWLDSAA